MKQILITAAVVLCSGVSMAQEQATKAKFDIEKFFGDWEYVAGKRGGEEVATERLVGTVTISKDGFKVPGGPDGDFMMSYTVDAEHSPAHIDFKIESGPVPEGIAKGLIKAEGDKLWLCYDPMGGERPEKLESTADNSAFLFELKRKKG